MELPRLEPMKVGEIVHRSFKLYGTHFLRFLSIFAVLHIPISALRLPYVLHKAAEKAALTQDEVRSGESFVFILDLPLIALLGFLATVVGFISGAAIFVSISGHYLGKDMGFGQAYRLVWTKIKTLLMLSLIWTGCFAIAPLVLLPSMAIMSIGHDLESVSMMMALSFITMVVLMALPIAILIIMLWFVLTVQCIMADGLSAWQSMKQSKGLVKGNMWRTIGLLMILMVIHLAVIWIAGWGGDLFMKTLLRGSVANAAALRHLRVTLVSTLFGPLFPVAMSLLYYDLRARKEDFPQEYAGEYLGQIETDPQNYNLVG